MSFILILEIAAFIVLIAALAIGLGWRKRDRGNRLVDYWMGLFGGSGVRS
jgi:hypothetical protein